MQRPSTYRENSTGGYSRIALIACLATVVLSACARESQEILQRPQVVAAVVNGMKILRECQKQDSLAVIVQKLDSLGWSATLNRAHTNGVDSLEKSFVLLEIRRFYSDQSTPATVRRAAEAFCELYRYGKVGYPVTDGGRIIEIHFVRYGHFDPLVSVNLFVMDSLARTSKYSRLINDLSVPRADSLRLFYNSLKWDRVKDAELSD